MKIVKNLLFIFAILLSIIFTIFLKITINLPYEAPFFWKVICWGIVNTSLIVWFYYLFLFTNGRLSKERTQQRLIAIHKGKFQTKYLIWLFPLGYAVIISFWIFQLPAYPTYFFANNSFEQLARVENIICHYPGRRSSANTEIYFIDEKMKIEDKITFPKNICKENPSLIRDITNKEVDFFGRKWLFGTFYDGFKLIQEQPNTSVLFNNNKAAEEFPSSISITYDTMKQYNSLKNLNSNNYNWLTY